MKTIWLKRMLVAQAVCSWAAVATAAADRLPAPKENPQVTNGTLQTPMMGTVTPQRFVIDAVIGGRKEVCLSQLALTNSVNTEVTRFAMKIIRDHSAANAKLEGIAWRQGLDVPNTNAFSTDDPNWNNALVQNPENAKGAYLLTTNLTDLADYETIKHMRTLSGRDFDLAYVKAILSDHINTIDEFEAASRTLSDPELRQFAVQTLPALRDHFRMAQKLDDMLSGMQASITDNTNYIEPSAIVTAGNDPL